MKIFNYLFLAGALLAMASCENDMEKLTYHSGEAQAAVLDTPAQTSLVLEARNEGNVALDLTWSKPDFGYEAIVTNNVELDLASNNFSNPRTIASGSSTTLEHTITVGDLNSNIINLLADNGIEEDFSTREYQLRIASSISIDADTLYSNVITLTITPYSMDVQYPKLWVVGKYCDWNHGNSQFLYSANFDDNYAGMIYFNGLANVEGWKLTPAGDWNNGEWGMSGTPAAEAPTQTLVTSGGGNITTYSHNSYYIEFNTSTCELKVSQGRDFWGVIGINGKWGDNDDIEMTYEAASDSNEGHNLTAVVEVTNGDTFKIRPDHAWDGEINADNIAFEGDVAKNDGDNNLKLTAGNGSYTIKWYFNKVEQKLVVTKN